MKVRGGRKRRNPGRNQPPSSPPPLSSSSPAPPPPARLLAHCYRRFGRSNNNQQGRFTRQTPAKVFPLSLSFFLSFFLSFILSQLLLRPFAKKVKKEKKKKKERKKKDSTANKKVYRPKCLRASCLPSVNCYWLLLWSVDLYQRRSTPLIRPVVIAKMSVSPPFLTS